MKQILFVCLGNICRSPLAQGIFEKQIEEQGIGAYFTADSAGTSGWHKGEAPDQGSIKIAAKYQIDISRQRSRPVHAKDRDVFDYIVAMDKSNYQNLISEFHVEESKLFLIRNFEQSGKDKDVPDPYSQGLNAFEEVYHILDRAMTGFIEFLKKKESL